MEDKSKLINYFQSVLPMSRDKAELLAEKFKYKEIKKNSLLLKENRISTETHFLEEGYIRSFVFDVQGQETTTAIYSAPCFANNFLSFFRKEPSRENLEAITDCKTWYLTYQEVQENFHSIPEFREWGRLILLNNYSILNNRMLEMIQDTAEQRYDKLIQIQPAIFQHVPLRVIASYLGIRDTSLSRIRREYSRKK